jgi:hypothetical protein
MGSYRSNRGYDTSLGNDNDVDDKKAKWGMVTSMRVLECLFPETPLADGNSVIGNNSFYVEYNADTLARRAKEYFQNIYQMAQQGTPIIPDVEDFCLFCRITRVTLMKYCTGHDRNLNICANNVVNAIAMCKKQMAFDGQIPPVIFAIDFNNNHDYVQQKYQVDMHSTIDIEAQDSINDIASRLPIVEEQKQIETDKDCS